LSSINSDRIIRRGSFNADAPKNIPDLFEALKIQGQIFHGAEKEFSDFNRHLSCLKDVKEDLESAKSHPKREKIVGLLASAYMIGFIAGAIILGFYAVSQGMNIRGYLMLSLSVSAVALAPVVILSIVRYFPPTRLPPDVSKVVSIVLSFVFAPLAVIYNAFRRVSRLEKEEQFYQKKCEEKALSLIENYSKEEQDKALLLFDIEINNRENLKGDEAANLKKAKEVFIAIINKENAYVGI